MTFAYIAKTILKKWITTLSSRGFGTQLVSHETQVALSSHVNKVPVDNRHCNNK
ncbi:hypothetical protein [Cognaticolwellia mytili]|uniref:hypothetical protein n=1 Tax=Cognaticolwellia mytili TaxID=1888913 RepID=UPI001301BEA4|nr:hypothetical protein [Cognaticolwellia mytili]